jgi:hypothetical protein
VDCLGYIQNLREPAQTVLRSREGLTGRRTRGMLGARRTVGAAAVTLP